MAIFRKFGMVLIILTIFSTSADCQITSLLNPQTVCIGKNVDLDWVYGNDANFLTVTWTYIDSQSSTKTIMQQITGGSAAPVNNYNVVPNTKFNGGITLTNVSIANTGSYKIRVTYSNASAVEDTVSVTVNDCSTTTTTAYSTTTTTTTSTTTTMPSTTTTTSTPSPTTIMPSTTTTLTTSTTTMPTTTTTPGRTSTASMPSSTSSTPTTTSISSSKSPSISTVGTTSDDGVSDEMILVIIIIPVGVLVVVGIITFFCIFHYLRKRRKLSENHESHRKGKHYKVNMRPLHQHQHTAKTAYGRHQAGEYNHKHQKGSQILHHEGHWYDLSNDNFYGNGIKQNPVYQGRNISRSYYSGSVPMYDYYRSQLTKGHVYPSHISEFQYRPENLRDIRKLGNPHHSYPGYSRQQQYHNPSYQRY